ncbi:murein biosynthesis integral membrane protein MurJ [Candidatus Haliotispira prima]|uniref:Murein biosynthesis integral membrane protein MurJ n=1 Tax=Candidatus Haliotispira prima TaxID=3034016 RepID=A0ABY8MDU3_9SPIO|nr:murein biosynthesis integral membrane protein MurJ [Candidatus Haliotispira prima]
MKMTTNPNNSPPRLSSGSQPSPEKHAEQKPASSAKPIVMVMLGTLSSRLLGFIRNAAIAFYFGAGERADVLNFIQAIPMLLRRLAAEGSLETALVPELSRSRERNPNLSESRLIWRKLLAIQWSIIFPLCLLLVLFPQQIIELLTEFPKREQTEIASRMLYFISPYVFLLSQSVLLGALLSSRQKFTLSSFTPLLSSIAVIAATVLLQSVYDVFAVLFGMLAGIILQLAFLLPPILRSGYSLIPDFRLKDPAIRRIRQVWWPLWLSTGLLALMQFIANYLASRAESGSVSAMTNALIFFQLPQGLIYASIAKVCLPRMSQLRRSESGDHSEQASQVLRYGLRQLFILLLPATIILFIMSEALIAVAFQRGAFRLQDTLLTAEVLRYYALGSFPIAVFRFLQQYLYAQSRRFQPLFQVLAVTLIDIPLSIFLINVLNMGVIALPIANTASYIVVTIYSYYVTARYSSGLLQRARWANICTGLLPKLLFICAGLLFFDAGLRWLEQYLFAGSPGWSLAQYGSSLQLASGSLADSKIWWWSGGGSLRNFAVLAVHGLSLLAYFMLLCRLCRIPLLKQR